MAALRTGTLTMRDGCLTISDSYSSNLVVWPPDFEVSIEHDTIRVRYDDWAPETEREVEVRLGQMVRLSGGEVKSLGAFDERTWKGIPAGCPGPYWLVGSITPVEEADLVGTDWVLISLHGSSPIEDTEINLVFEDAYLGGSMTCNGYGGGPDSGKYTARDDGSLTIPHEIAVTLQLCSEPEGVMEQEAAYIEALRNAAAYRLINGRLEIANTAGETTLVFAR
jgi:heat shock protein HslJ